jgi:hypothetical protein
VKRGHSLGLLILAVPLIAQAQARIKFAPTAYCSQVERFSSLHEPKIFARTDGSNWAVFRNAEEWKHAGSPMPLALAWERDEDLVRVAIATQKGRRYNDYCYRTDGTLAMSRLMPQKEVRCDAAHVRCQMTLRVGQFHRSDGKAWKASSNSEQMREAEMLGALDSWQLRPESATVSLDLSTPPEYLKISDFPFYGLLSPVR